MDLPEKIARLRGGDSPETLAGRVGCAGTTIRRIEAGVQEPKVGLAYRLAETFEVPLDWLADDSLGWPPPRQDQTGPPPMPALPPDEGLTKAERDIIRAWRELTPELQGRLMGYLAGLNQVTTHQQRQSSATPDQDKRGRPRPEV